MLSSMNAVDVIPHLHVVCYRWGEKYGVEYVNILRGMVKRGLSVPHTFHCITDSREGLDPAIVAHDLPDYGIEGIWRKLMTFESDFLGLNGEYVVSIDLDVVIVGSLDFVAEHPEHDFVIARNWGKIKNNVGARGSGSLYRLKVGSCSHVWERFIENPAAAIHSYHGKNLMVGEQNWLNANFKEFVYFPDGKVVSFKRHCKAKGHTFFGKLGDILGLSTANIGVARVPDGASMVSFHGDPLPPDVRFTRNGRWRRAPFVEKFWHV